VPKHRDNTMRPLLPPLMKWPGGKRALIKHLLPLVPTSRGRYYEPFFGGGALFFALGPRPATLGDTNAALIACYEQVRDKPERVLRFLETHPNAEDEYYRVRARTPDDLSECAARMIYLATLSFNGIYRLNRHGEFNVPYGRKTHLQVCDPSRISAASAALQGVTLVAGDFEAVVGEAGLGDFVYFDPPYTVAHGNNGFLKYNAAIFSWEDQVRLAQRARKLIETGCRVVISNADHPSIRDLYAGFALKTIERPSVMAASSAFRRVITECIFYNEE
jgi:DNA adenine methylase